MSLAKHKEQGIILFLRAVIIAEECDFLNYSTETDFEPPEWPAGPKIPILQ
jgi:hypothetical protein